MNTDSLHHRYFRAKEGHWRGVIRFEITNSQWLRESPLCLRDKWSMWFMDLVSRRLATLILSTSVDYASQGHKNEVLHTTRMSNLGITLFRSRESIQLDDGGHNFRMTGTQAFFPRLWKATDWVAHGAVAADHDGAVYHIPFFGVILEQRTRMTSHGLEVIQTTPFSCANILLRWQGAIRPSERNLPSDV